MAEIPQNPEKQKEILRFDIVTDYSDHHFRQKSNKPSNKVCKKIMQEWNILQNNLPDSITVRVYENRIDLLRAVIVGAAGTPYHDGLYVFDLLFPCDYPYNPPKVHYHSFGNRINPNLYADGFVCLSLLNTWTGTVSEKWNPLQSTILQVLVSIQGLILNQNPYYNEPLLGWFSTVHFEERSRRYNENVFLMNCKSMMSVIKMKPKNLEELVVDHFKNRGNSVLEACNAYRNGETELGFYEGSSSSSSSLGVLKSNKVDVSKNFKAKMDMLFPNLVKGFSGIGAILSDHVIQQYNVGMYEDLEPVSEGKKEAIGFFGWIRSKLLDMIEH